MSRQYHLYQERYTRAHNQKERLETLCKELQRRNKLVNEEIRNVSTEQQKQHKELKEKFEASLE